MVWYINEYCVEEKVLCGVVNVFYWWVIFAFVLLLKFSFKIYGVKNVSIVINIYFKYRMCYSSGVFYY